MRFEEVNGNIFYNGDCIAGARVYIPDGSIDLIVTDPPYGINGDRLHQHYNRDETFVVEGYVEVPAAGYGEFSRRWIREAERILRPGGSIYIVSGYTNLYHILAALRETGLREVNHIIWKYNFGIYTSRKYVSSHYHILFYEKPGGERTFNLESRYGAGEKAPDNGSLNYRDREDVWIINREYKPGKVKNKNELPTELLVKMIQYSSNEGDLVCDMFLGGFSTARVAIGLNRRATGFEISGQVFDLKAAEMRDVAQGWLLPSLRVPQSAGPENRGKPWTDGDQKTLISRYTGLIESGETKKNAVAIVGRELGRGRWSIEKMLKIQGVRAGRRERRAATAKRP
ncbi:MAG: DNA methylase N-4/N-6 domain protein [Methanoculleus marisnigri]|jgi:DNA modification methylase|uniref:Type II methyltransferase n=1 Tax=Methanoculleus marisnigri TaxID=2198 RepID=A0A117LQK2_9EURY|nr:site-specific DNA-methyltransferase [Methanoculleus marisnigri]KUK61854.1 MAG: DNA methylase N-4/N-6 domain protein [Methanoculleus marisnigri]KUL00490.1 MAG: DNA methylase N-4/N-6 domain protein [Methanoculleus marisnigri]